MIETINFKNKLYPKFQSIGNAAQFNSPTCLAADYANNYLYVSESRGHCIRRVNMNTREVITIAGQPGISGYADGIRSNALFNKPEGIVFENSAGQNYLYVCDTGNAVIRKIILPP